MSFGNSNDQNNKGKNTPWQRAVLVLLSKIAGTPTSEQTEVSGDSGAITGNSAVVVIATPGANLNLYITSILVTNSHATQGTLVSFQDVDGNAVEGATGYAAPTGGGYTVTLPTPIKVSKVNSGLYVICGTSGANVYVSAVGYKA